jgi:hypothetical protein
MLLALAVVGIVIGMAVAIGLFLWFDARRARLISQFCAAFIGGAFLPGNANRRAYANGDARRRSRLLGCLARGGAAAARGCRHSR